MWPILASVSLGDGTIDVPAYGTFLVLAAVTSLALAARGATRLGVSGRAAIAAYSLAIVAGVVGARLLDVVLDWGPYAQDRGRIVALEPSGFALVGGLAAGLLVALTAARRWGRSAWALADSAIPAVAAGIVLMRVGCFLGGCCGGSPTDLPWGVVFPSTGPGLDSQILASAGLLQVSDAAVAVHPTQLYELVAALGCAAIALRLRRRSAAPGLPALAFAAAFLVFRAGTRRSGCLLRRRHSRTCCRWPTSSQVSLPGRSSGGGGGRQRGCAARRGRWPRAPEREPLARAVRATPHASLRLGRARPPGRTPWRARRYPSRERDGRPGPFPPAMRRPRSPSLEPRPARAGDPGDLDDRPQTDRHRGPGQAGAGHPQRHR